MGFDDGAHTVVNVDATLLRCDSAQSSDDEFEYGNNDQGRLGGKVRDRPAVWACVPAANRAPCYLTHPRAHHKSFKTNLTTKPWT